MTWAVEQKLPCAQKMVLLMLTNHANGHTGRCDPSLTRLAEECGMSRDSVMRHIKTLEENGYLTVIRQKDGEINLRNKYELNLLNTKGVGADTPPGVAADSDQGTRCELLGVVAPCDQGSSTMRPRVVAPCDSNQEYKPGSKPYIKSGKPDIAHRIIEYLNAKAGRDFKFVKANIRFIAERLKEGATEEQLKQVIDMKCRDWLHDDEFTEYLRPSTLFNAIKYAQYVGTLSLVKSRSVRSPADEWRPASER
jgi:uncharacterized phage protein (TIGR02220 family)